MMGPRPATGKRQYNGGLKRRELRLLTEASIALTSELSPDVVLQKVVDLSRRLVDARYGALAVHDGRGGNQRFIVSGISDKERQRIGHLPQGLGVLGLIRRRKRPLIVQDLAAHPRSAGFPPHHPPMRTFLGAPINFKGKNLGSLYLTERVGRPCFDRRDAEILEIFAAHAAVAIENARLHDQAARLAVVEERERIGMELHDGVIQSLYSTGLALEEELCLVDESPEEAKVQTRKVINSINHTMREIRLYISDLKVDLHQFESMRRGLEELAGEFQAASGMEISLIIDKKVDSVFEPRQRLHVFQVCREALTNVSKHACATAAVISLVTDDDAVALGIRDNGIGFNPEHLRDGAGSGLNNMRRRARALGGSFHVVSRPGEGAEISLRVPVAPRR